MGRGPSTRQTRERTPKLRGPLAAMGGRRCRLAGRDSLWEVDEYPVALQPTEGTQRESDPPLTREGGTRHHVNTQRRQKRRPGPQALLLSTPTQPTEGGRWLDTSPARRR